MASKYLRADIRPSELISEYLTTWQSSVFRNALYKRGWKKPRSKVLAQRLGVLIGVCSTEFSFHNDSVRQDTLNAIITAFNEGASND